MARIWAARKRPGKGGRRHRRFLRRSGRAGRRKHAYKAPSQPALPDRRRRRSMRNARSSRPGGAAPIAGAGAGARGRHRGAGRRGRRRSRAWSSPSWAAIVIGAARLFFDIPLGTRLSASVAIDPLRALVVPAIGGLLLGIAGLSLARWGPERFVDPIEANAVRGGRMSFRGSMIVALQTVWSSGVGASVGLEAGYTQARQRHRVVVRPRVPSAPQRPAAAGRLRRGRRHRGRLRRAVRAAPSTPSS